MIRTRAIGALTVGGIGCHRAQCMHTCDKKSLSNIQSANRGKNLQGKSALVVGGTSGIGEGIARRLAKAQVSVTIAGRNEKRGKEIVEDLYKLSSSNGNEKVFHSFERCDTSTLHNIQSFCTNFQSKMQTNNKPLDFLVLTQGIATMQGRKESSEGIDEKLQLHYFGRMYFIECLLPLLRQSQNGGKVLSVLSAGVHKPYEHYHSDFELKTHFSLINAAHAAGMYNDLCLEGFALQPGNEKVAFIHAAPGVVNSSWGKEFPTPLRVLVNAIKPLIAKSIDDCGEIMADSLIGEESLHGAILIDENGNTAKKMELKNYTEAREFVWEQTRLVFDKVMKGN